MSNPNVQDQSWEIDAPSGAYKNRKLSEDVLRAAIAMCHFLEHCSTKDALGANAGESITIPRYGNISTSDSDEIANEFADLPQSRQPITSKVITVKEFGREIPFTGFNKTLSPSHLEGELKFALQKRMNKQMDRGAATAFKSTLTKYTALTASTGSFQVNGTPLTAASNVNLYHTSRVRDYMVSNLEQDAAELKLLASTMAYRGLETDSRFVSWMAPQNAELKKSGMVGKIDGIEVREIADQVCLPVSKGTGNVLGEALLIANKPVALVTARNPEVLIYQLDKIGRKFGASWYGIFNFAAKYAADSVAAGEADIIHLSSNV